MEAIQNADIGILLYIQEHLRIPTLNPVMRTITNLGEWGIIWFILIALLMIFPKTRRAALAGLIAILLSTIVTELTIKNLICRPRPFDVAPALIPLIPKPDSFSFPSGHAASSMSVAAAFFGLLPRRQGIAAVCLALFIAYTRLYVGVHYPTDVLAGLLIGGLIGTLVSGLLRRPGRRGKVRQTRPETRG